MSLYGERREMADLRVVNCNLVEVVGPRMLAKGVDMSRNQMQVLRRFWYTEDKNGLQQ
jgi:hypothetical protein